MNTRDIIKLAAQLYVYDAVKKYKKCNSILFLPTSKALDSLIS